MGACNHKDEAKLGLGSSKLTMRIFFIDFKLCSCLNFNGEHYRDFLRYVPECLKKGIISQNFLHGCESMSAIRKTQFILLLVRFTVVRNFHTKDLPLIILFLPLQRNFNATKR